MSSFPPVIPPGNFTGGGGGFSRANAAAGEPVVQTVAFITGVSVGGFVFMAAVMVFLCLCVVKQRERYVKVPLAPPEQAMII